jgi:hypothetical protein
VQTEIQKNPTVLAWRGERELRMLWGILQCASFPFLMIFPLSTFHDPDSRNSSVQIAVAVETVSTSLCADSSGSRDCEYFPRSFQELTSQESGTQSHCFYSSLSSWYLVWT